MDTETQILNAVLSMREDMNKLKEDMEQLKKEMPKPQFDYKKVVKCTVDDNYLAEQIKLATMANKHLHHFVDVQDRNCYSKVQEPARLAELWRLAEQRNKYKREPRILSHFRGLLGEDCCVELVNTVYNHFNINKLACIDETIRKDTDHGEDFRFGFYVIDTKYRHHKGRELALKDKEHIHADILLFAEGECEIDHCICENNDVARTTTLKGYISKSDFCKHSNRKTLRSDQSPKWVLPAYKLNDMNFLVRIALAEYIKNDL